MKTYVNGIQVCSTCEKVLQGAADLMTKGYQVFRALTPDAECDLVVISKGKCYRVEVKSTFVVYVGKDATVAGSLVASNKYRYDILAEVVNGSILYTPSLDDTLGRPESKEARDLRFAGKDTL